MRMVGGVGVLDGLEPLEHTGRCHFSHCSHSKLMANRRLHALNMDETIHFPFAAVFATLLALFPIFIFVQNLGVDAAMLSWDNLALRRAADEN